MVTTVTIRRNNGEAISLVGLRGMPVARPSGLAVGDTPGHEGDRGPSDQRLGVLKETFRRRALFTDEYVKPVSSARRNSESFTLNSSSDFSWPPASRIGSTSSTFAAARTLPGQGEPKETSSLTGPARRP
ncbi:hypothetical protein [Streptomyces sp. NPDC090135]|uniref:hypothetical protein n=1 Tax=Streptomyces sp. NPDC090135 TaxID=3365957 RepID=UPI003807143A